MGKIISMDYIVYKGRWTQEEPRQVERLSRWIAIKQNYNPSPRNSLYDYVRDGYGRGPQDKDYDPKGLGAFLDYFTWQGRNYAMEQFLRLGNPFWCPCMYQWEEDGEDHGLIGMDMEDLYHPIMIEVDGAGEYVRVYREV